MNALSLFSGCGGDTKGMEDIGINVSHFVEYIKNYQKSHLLNFPHSILIGDNGDITKIPNSEYEKLKNHINIIFAGFPCQSFSTGGQRKEEDPRNTMFMYFVQSVSIIQPDIIIGENVKGLLTKKTSNKELYIDIIIKEFEKINYTLKYKVLQCDKFGIPQKRERLFIIGIRNDKLNLYHLDFPKPTNENNDLKHIIKYSMERSIRIKKSEFDFNNIPDECIIKNMDDNTEEQNPHPYIISKVRGPDSKRTYQGITYPQILSFGKRASPIHLEIIDIRKPCKTIICTYNHQPRLFVPIQNAKGYFCRMLTINELLQIQSFPDNYKFKLYGNDKEQITQIGNSVPPKIVSKIFETIITK
jgi:DNA (cytosine-5)-methyltransferase 1